MNRKIALVLCVLCACASGASRDRPSAAHTPSAQWLLQIEQAHAEADRAQATASARAALERARDVQVPSQVSEADRRRVLQDVQFRLAVLALELPDGKAAVNEAERGLALGAGDDEFTANLWIAKGRGEAAQGKAKEAAVAYSAALAIHEHLLDRALQGKP
jgi:hypothetical protein